jgi:hypothetical protein
MENGWTWKVPVSAPFFQRFFEGGVRILDSQIPNTLNRQGFPA